MKNRRSKGRKGLGAKEKRRLIQLGVCLAVFCAVFFGRGFLPTGMAALRQAITADTDFEAVFFELGRTLEPEGQVAQAFGLFWTGTTPAPSPIEATPTPTAISTAEPIPVPTLEPTPEPIPEPTPEPTPEPVPQPTSYPYDGPDAPADATMAYDPLELTETMDPIQGRQTDGYGWRIHPITGEDNFHHGLDLAAPEGTKILAFADGYVDFVGEGDGYGKYVQLRHSDHVTTLYAHCSELLLPKGTAVKMGDPIALVGDTGLATGPHLHFEVKVDGVWHDPIYYVEQS